MSHIIQRRQIFMYLFGGGFYKTKYVYFLKYVHFFVGENYTNLVHVDEKV